MGIEFVGKGGSKADAFVDSIESFSMVRLLDGLN